MALAEGDGGGAELLLRDQHAFRPTRARLLAVKPDGELFCGVPGNRAGIGLARHQIGGDFAEIAALAGDEVNFVAVEELLLLDAVPQELQQVGDLFLEALAALLRRATRAGVIDLGARRPAQRDFPAGLQVGPVVAFECLVDGQVVLDDAPFGFPGGDHQAVGEKNVGVEADGLQPFPGVEPEALPPLCFGVLAAEEIGGDRRGDEQALEWRQVATDRHLPFGQRLQ